MIVTYFGLVLFLADRATTREEGVRKGAGSSRRGRLPRASGALGPDLATDS